jgi:hypothetical protein
MTEKSVQWVNTCNRFVAFMDIMGFKDRLYRNKHQSVLETMASFHKIIEVIELIAKHNFTGEQAPPDDLRPLLEKSAVRPVVFSDSLLLVSSDDSDLSAAQLLTFAEIVMAKAALKSIPMKGAVAYGEETADFERSLHFGRPLVDAYELQNELMMYSVIIHHSMERHLADKKLLSQFEDIHLHRYATPLRAGPTLHYVVSWDAALLADDKLEEVLSGFYGTVSGTPRRYVDNTADFLRWLAKRNKPAQVKGLTN